MKKDCLFCKISNSHQKSFTILENDYFIAILDVFPQSLGHVLVMPKNHSKNLLECEEIELTMMMPIIQKIAKAIEKTFQPDGIFIRSNINEEAGQTVFHTHIHIVPVYNKPKDLLVNDEIANKIKHNIK